MTESDDYFDAYKHHSGVLRTWLVAYGIGGPVIALTNEHVWQTLKLSPFSTRIAWCFLIGVALQVCLTALNKYIMWASYYGEGHPEYLLTRRYKFARFIRGFFIIDFFVDLLTMVLFGSATVLMFIVLTS